MEENMEQPKLIKVTAENIANEHICCAISDKKHDPGVACKKDWMGQREKDGFVFLKADLRGKALIQYAPAEKAWMPIKADGYTAIECFWVSGSHAGKGTARRLLTQCLEESKSANGIVVVVGNKKRPFLNDKAFFKHFGFEVCDSAPPYFELMVKKFNPKAENPKFAESAKSGKPPSDEGFVMYYSHGCPFTPYYVEEGRQFAQNAGIKFQAIHIDTLEKAQNHICPFTIHTLYYNGKFMCHEIVVKAKLEKFAKL